MSQVVNPTPKKKLSNVAFRTALVDSGVDTDIIETLVANAVAKGTVSSSSRVGKLGFAPESLKRKIEELEAEFTRCKDEWNANLPSGQTVSKISINCNK
jgi:hypothetical protein|tara:strand:+ start:147 stop:443 length:297 start_codon:yes stop_codon:yes gene_type:complete